MARPNRTRAIGWGRSLLFVVILIVVGGCAEDETAGQGVTTTTAIPSTTGSAPTTTTGGADVVDLYDVSALVDQVSAGVVSVTQSQTRIDPFGNPQEIPAGTGTGIVVDDGLVLTNAHVIAGAESVVVVGADGQPLQAEIVASSPPRDLALLTVEASESLVPIPLLDDSEQLEVGSPAIAIGNALGLDLQDLTVSAGIISAIDRTIVAEGSRLEHLIQTDAAINRGNSGGPLLNGSGEVIGINTVIAGGEAQNVGFAIPSSVAIAFIEQYRTGEGEAFLGVAVVSNNASIAGQIGVDVETGAVVAEVEPGSPASDAGLAQGDVIIALDGDEILDAPDLTDAVIAREPGEILQLTVVDTEGEHTVEVELGERSITG